MRARGVLAGVAAMLLLAAMFVAVHRGAHGRAIAESIGQMHDRREAAAVRQAELEQRIEQLRSRTRVVRVASRLGLHLPSEDELVILDLSGTGSRRAAGSQ
jgi:cell division protein FtsL